MRKRTYVKPVRSQSQEWVELELTPFENFVDDIQRFGLGRALHNAIVPFFIADLDEAEAEETIPTHPNRRIMTVEYYDEVQGGVPSPGR